MKVLVANLGSTSFKYRLFDMATEKQLARGGVERIGDRRSRAFVEFGNARRDMEVDAPDHVTAVALCLEQLTDAERGCLRNAAEVSAIGFKAVHGGRLSGVRFVENEVLEAMAEMNQVAPAHNPPYLAAMRQLRERLPEIPLVAAFETGFHQTIPERLRSYAVPHHWKDDLLIARWGFHGASHRYVAQRTAKLIGRSDLRVLSCHLGGSSSLCAIRNGQSVATTMGMSPQSGLPQSNRTGDFDVFALPVIMASTGKSLDEVLNDLAEHSGLVGLSGISGDIRDLENAAADGNERAQLALDVYVTAIRHYLGAYLVELGGVDLIAFTGGTGENSATVRRNVCRELHEFGIVLDDEKNTGARAEGPIHASASRTEIWIVPTNEELIVARQIKELLENTPCS
jgi:acetate kinase